MKIVLCQATKNKDYLPPKGSKIDKCNKCKTLVWLPREAELAKSEREVWCSSCVDAHATDQDNVLGRNSENSFKTSDYSDLEDRIIQQQKELNSCFEEDIESKLGIIAAVAINNLAPNKDSEQLMLAVVIKTFIEQRLFSIKEKMNGSLIDVLNRFTPNEKVSILTFILGTNHAARYRTNINNFPSWNKADNGQVEAIEEINNQWEWDDK
jgi:hypothetical protein